MADLQAAERMIAMLNELLTIDPDAITDLCEQRVECNEELANHPDVQVSGITDPDVMSLTGPMYRVGLLGVLNGICGSYGEEAGDKKGWGPITAEFGENIIKRFRMTKCIQCINPHYDGICSCGGWGDAEVEKARLWHVERQKEVAAGTKEPISDLERACKTPIKDLERLWDR